MPDRPVRRPDLRADCTQCVGLCCVALAMTASADFAIDKPAGQPCPNLKHDFRCGIHARLRDGGFPGCTVYDCFGAGQKVTQITFGGRDWRQAADSGAQMFEVFSVVRLLHELLWYLIEALELAPSLHGPLRRATDDTEQLALGSPESLTALDVLAHRSRINDLLLRTSELVRAGVSATPLNRRGADLMGADLAGADLRGADLRSSYLIGADLRRADLTSADLIGADLRDTDVRGAHLARSIFLTQMQVNATRGDAGTTLPDRLIRPPHWS
ncbi:pentapeptide repeat-containing protein [Kribbella jiaozuonensis]|uniref:Pentapeptide repeat-containing protein n=1 Tax=Kribbella jiaozuonensis TaxID=2575441 RepID=A0A4U3LNY4_9ACTN|nr:pentapeptide repeat-containing protein [Kribbella jiaozuonensis]TKK76216.1 pentapeptide repeat-containing protein [Kribbella jiaozuonensis]